MATLESYLSAAPEVKAGYRYGGDPDCCCGTAGRNDRSDTSEDLEETKDIDPVLYVGGSDIRSEVVVCISSGLSERDGNRRGDEITLVQEIRPIRAIVVSGKRNQLWVASTVPGT